MKVKGDRENLFRGQRNKEDGQEWRKRRKGKDRRGESSSHVLFSRFTKYVTERNIDIDHGVSAR